MAAGSLLLWDGKCNDDSKSVGTADSDSARWIRMGGQIDQGVLKGGSVLGLKKGDGVSG